MKYSAFITILLSVILTIVNAQVASLGGLTIPTPGPDSTGAGGSTSLPIDSSVNTPVPPIATSATPGSSIPASSSTVMSSSALTTSMPSSTMMNSSSTMASSTSSGSAASSSATNAASAFTFGSKEMVVAAWIAGLAIPMVL